MRALRQKVDETRSITLCSNRKYVIDSIQFFVPVFLLNKN